MSFIVVVIVTATVVLVGGLAALFLAGGRLGLGRGPSGSSGQHRADRPAGPGAETMNPERLGGDHSPPETERRQEG